MQVTGVNYYSVLGVSSKASDSDIKQKYRELSKKYHPDTVGGDTQRMSLINEAYAVLSNPLKRREYEPPTPKPAPAAATTTYQKAPPKRYAAKRKAQVELEEDEPENMWYVFFSYLLAVPVAILIVSVGFPILQRMLPKAEAVSGTTQTTQSTSTSTPVQQAPTITTQTAPTATSPAAAPPTTSADTTDTQTQKNSNRSNFYYERRFQQSQQSNNN